MKQIFKGFILTAVLVFLVSACTVHVPFGMDWDSPAVRVVLIVEPEDAQVLVNGKWIGEAYEFSTRDAAIRLASRNNEIVIKRKGYIEEVVDLYDYEGSTLNVRMKLRRDKDYRDTGDKTASRPPRPPEPPRVTEKIESKKADKEIPEVEAPIEDLNGDEPVAVTLEISPDEASIYLNGKFWGIAPPSGRIENLRLKPGKYTIEVVKPGYKTYRKELNLKVQEVNLNIKLEKN
jgi:hypothetical protein